MKKAALFLSVFILTACGPTDFLPAQVKTRAQEAVEALQELNSRVIGGLTNSEYGQRVNDARVVVDRFKRESGADAHPAYNSIIQALAHYDFAGDVWDCQLEGVSDQKEGFHSAGGGSRAFPPTECDGPILTTRYKVETHTFSWGEKTILLSQALSEVWSEAEKEADKSSALLN